MCRTNIYIINGKSCRQALNVEEHKQENDKGQDVLLGPFINKIIIKCHQKNDKPLPSTKIILEPIQKVFFAAVEEVNQLKKSRTKMNMCECVCVCVVCVALCLFSLQRATRNKQTKCFAIQNENQLQTKKGGALFNQMGCCPETQSNLLAVSFYIKCKLWQRALKIN